MSAAIVDTGPLVAFLDSRERHHAWAAARIEELEAPLLVCEPLLAEVMYLLAHLEKAQGALFRFLENGALRIGLQIGEHAPALRALHRKYRDVPMSLADACIVRMAELNDRHAIFTLDSHFAIYRKQRREPLSLIHP